MKKQEAGKKSLKWILLSACAAVLVVAGVVAVLLFGRGGQPATEPTEQHQQGLTVSDKLYLNVEQKRYFRKDFMRRTDENGLVTFTLAVDGEQQRYQVADVALAKYMDTMEVMGLTFDQDGVIVDARPVEEFTGGFAVRRYYVSSIEGDQVVCNSAPLYDGYDKTLTVTGDTPVYFGLENDLLAGAPTQLNLNDEVTAVQDKEGKLLGVYTNAYREPGDIYWNVQRMYNSTANMTTRPTNVLGEYEFVLAVNGEQVTLRTRSYDIATAMDKVAGKSFGLTFDENGEIIEVVDAKLATGGGYFSSWYHIIETADRGRTIYTKKNADGADKGTEQTGILSKDCKIFDVSQSAEYVGVPIKMEELVPGDQIHALTDSRGQVCVIFVINKKAESPLYWNVERKRDNKTLLSTRTPDANGYYWFKLAVNGQQTTVKCKDKAMVDFMDGQAAKHFGLKLNGSEVVGVYTPNQCTGGNYFGSWYDVTSIEDGVVTATRLIEGDKNYGKQTTARMAKDCKVYNVSTGHNYFVGEETTLRVGDRIHGQTNYKGELVVIYVVDNRTVDATLYWNVERKWDSKEGKSTRQPNAEGWYEFLLAGNGKQVTVKTKDTELVEQMDGKADRYFGLRLNGDVVSKYYHPNVVCGGKYFASWCDVQTIGADGTVMAERTITTASNFGEQYTAKMAPGCKVYNVSTNGNFDEFSGEKTTLRLGDRIQGHRNKQGQLVVIYVVSRLGMPEVAHSCTHVKDNVKWKEWNGKLDIAESGYYVLTQDITLPKTRSFADNIEVTLCLNGHTITGADGLSALTVRYGTKLTICDHKGKDGTFQGGIKTNFKGNAGGVFYGYDGSVVNIYGGNYENTGTAQQGAIGAMGNKNAGCNLNIYDGLFKGTDASTRGGAFVLYRGAVMHMYGGRIEGGSSLNGGSIFAFDSTELHIHGGTITGGRTYKNEKGQEGSGGNLFLKDGAVLEITGGIIENGTAQANGGNIFVGGAAYKEEAPKAYAKVTVSGGTIRNGKTTEGSGGNIILQNAVQTTISGGTIADGISAKNAGNISLTRYDVDEYSDATLTITGGTISGGVAANQGGGIWVYKGVLTMTGGKLVGREATLGRAIYMIGSITKTILDGNAVVESATEDKTNLVAYSSGQLTLGGDIQVAGIKVTSLDKFKISEKGLGSASIGIEMPSPAPFLTAQEALLPNFTAVHPDLGVRHKDGKLTLYVTRSEHMHCLCNGESQGVGTHTCEQTPFLAWSDATSLPVSGNYYLTTDVVLTAKVDPTVGGTTLNLCLNGHTVKGPENGQVFVVRTGLNITDCSGQEKWGSIIAGGDVNGGVFYMYDNYGGAEVNLFAGILKHSLESTTKSGGVAYMGNKNMGTTVFNMYGGELQGVNITSSNSGGTLYMQDQATFNLYDGTITGGSARSGGNIYTKSKSAKINLHGGTVSDGTAVFGGNIYIITSGANLTMTGGTVTGGTAHKDGNGSGGMGSNILVSGGASMEMTGGTVGAAMAKNAASLHLGNSKLILSGKPVIFGHEGQNLYMADAKGSLELGALQEGAKIGISMATPGKLGTTDETAYFLSDSEDYEVVYEGGELKLKAIIKEHKHCLCNGNSKNVGTHTCDDNVVWTPWADSTKLPTTGYYYLTTDVTLSAANDPKAGGSTLNLCLNGHTVNTSSEAIGFVVYTGLNITDCSAQAQWGSIIANADKNGGVFYMYDNHGGSEVNLFAGTLKHSKASISKTGGIAYMGNKNKGKTVFNMYGGTLQGTKSSANGATLLMQDQATFNMYGGTIQGGSGASGGNIYGNNANITVNLHGGTVSGGKATSWGGNICILKGKLNIGPEATVTGGTSGSSGGNIYANGAAAVVIEGTVTEGTARWGGNAYIKDASSTLTVKGGMVSGGSASDQGANLYATASAKLIMKDGTVGAGKTSTGSVELGDKAGIELSGKVVIYGHTAANLLLNSTNNVVTLGTLEEGAKIGISMKTPGTFGTVNATAYFVSDASTHEVVFEGGELKLKAKAV